MTRSSCRGDGHCRHPDEEARMKIALVGGILLFGIVWGGILGLVAAALL
jgi:hypothetical protein